MFLGYNMEDTSMDRKRHLTAAFVKGVRHSGKP